ncbi:hypothetical protein ACFC0M_22095 [Streptomyces sp. NPDC056149]|jgi:hypothetical protein|uniref:hypothetical protein n=1 Tax=unclassified Streptomyces TaxID=2593676 RepID=UPI00238111C5|nr:hypothetical protein [Streptomyces sp. WZ-12]
MATAKKVAMYVVIIFVLWTIIATPKKAAGLVQIGFEGISTAAHSVGEFMTQLVS